MKMDDNDLEVLDCNETPRETPEPSERASNIAVDLVTYNIHLTVIYLHYKFILNIICIYLIL